MNYVGTNFLKFDCAMTKKSQNTNEIWYLYVQDNFVLSEKYFPEIEQRLFLEYDHEWLYPNSIIVFGILWGFRIRLLRF